MQTNITDIMQQFASSLRKLLGNVMISENSDSAKEEV